MGNLLCLEKREEGDERQVQNSSKSLNPYPQQNLFQFDEASFDSRFDGGNLMLAEKANPGFYNLWIAPDCFQTEFETKNRVWFFFKVFNIFFGDQQTRTFTFKIKNMNRLQMRNYKNGMVPVVCSPSTGNTWRYLSSPLTEFTPGKGFLEIAFQYTFTPEDSQGAFFAFTFPYNVSDCQNFMAYLENTLANDKDIYFHRETVNYSLDGRPIDLLTITAYDPNMAEKDYEREPSITGLFGDRKDTTVTDPTMITKKKERPLVFKNKKYIFLTSRVHPCESPASFMLQSFITSLINKSDPVNVALLTNFVFVIIPMLNPDGVFRGHYRCDTKGRDLNRVYHKLKATEHPGPYAAMQVAKSLGGRMAFYIDMHAHSQKDSGFVFANYSTDVSHKVEVRVFARLFDIYSRYFDFNSCGFGAAPNPEKEDPSKKGVGKTEIGKATGCYHCYTLESSYYHGIKDPVRYIPKENPDLNLKRQYPHVLTFREFEEIGSGLRLAFAEYFGINPISFMNNTIYSSLDNLRNNIQEILTKNSHAEEESGEEEGN